MTTAPEPSNPTETAHRPNPPAKQAATHSSWRWPLVRYITAIGTANLVWEFAHMPLYTLWETGTTPEIVFAAVHCTAGDILIALFAVVAAVVIAGNWHQPQENQLQVAAVAIFLGLAYTAFSEWLNIEVRGAWAYRDLMPVIPVVGMGLSPFLQWIIIPVAGFKWALRTVNRGMH